MMWLSCKSQRGKWLFLLETGVLGLWFYKCEVIMPSVGNCELHRARLSTAANFDGDGTQPICIRISEKSCKARTVPWKIWRRSELCSRSDSWLSCPPPYLGRGQGQRLPEQGSNFPSTPLFTENVISGTRVKVSDFFCPPNLRLFPPNFICASLD